MYKAVTNEAGEVSYVEMTAEEIAELVKGSEPYKAIKEEAIEQRKKYQSLRDKPAAEPEAQPAAPQKQFDPDALVDQLYQRITDRFNEQDSKQKEREALLDKLVKDNKLKPEAKEVLALASNPEAAAASLARIGLTFDTAEGGNPDNPGDNTTAIMGRVYEMLGLKP